MRASEIDAELAAANRWWRDPEDWRRDDVQLRAADASPLDYRPDPLAELVTGGLYILRGPRRVGKSTVLKRLVADRLAQGDAPRRILHVSVEGRDARDLTDLVRQGAERWLQGEPGDRLWLIDEIAAVKGDWPAAIKRLRDAHAGFAADTVVLTGSSSARFDEATRMLAGRRNAVGSDRVLFQMGFVDVARALGADLPSAPGLEISALSDDARLEILVDEVRPWVPDLVDAWDRYLEVGGYPQGVAAALESGTDRAEALDEALWHVIHADAFAGSEFTHTQTQALLRSVARSLGSLLSVHSAANTVGAADRTVHARLDALRRAFVAFPVHREQGFAPRPGSQSKWYFTDPRLAALASAPGAGTAPDRPALSEQQVAVALLGAIERGSPGAALRHDRLLHYRSSTRAEIDFVGADFTATCVESKFVDRAWGRAFQTIEASGRATGIVATRSGLGRHDGGWAMPAGVLAFLLGS